MKNYKIIIFFNFKNKNLWTIFIIFMHFFSFFSAVADSHPSTMRQLKGKVKETNKQKKERKKEFMENKEKVFTIVIPVTIGLFMLLVAYVYFKTRPRAILDMEN